MRLTTREAHATFADLICADQQWVDAEFAALISASFGQPPAPPPHAPPRVPPRPGIPRRFSWHPAQGAATMISPAIGLAQGRQRSPPAHPLPGRRPPENSH